MILRWKMRTRTISGTVTATLLVGNVARNTTNRVLLSAADREVVFDDLTAFEQDSPATLGAGNNNGYDPGIADTLRLTADAGGSTITGITQTSPGRRLRLVHVGGGALTIAHENAGSTATERIRSPTGGNVVLAVDDAIELEYDSTTARWRVVGLMQ